MFLNGEPIIMRGMCNHQDLGPLGTALWDEALERRLKMLKDIGVNVLRTAHYPHSPEFMRMADEIGFLVINETFDEWRRSWNFVDNFPKDTYYFYQSQWPLSFFRITVTRVRPTSMTRVFHPWTELLNNQN